MSAQAMTNLVTEFGKSIGIDELTMDEENRCNLVFDSIAVSFELSRNEDAVYIYSYVGDMKQVDKEKLQTILLDLNYLLKGTDGTCIGVEQRSGKIAVTREELLTGLRLQEFGNIVERFVNYVEAFREKVLNGSTGGGTDASARSSTEDVPDPNALKV